MSILLDSDSDLELDARLTFFARAQATYTTKTGMARSILQRAARMDLHELQMWLGDGSGQARRHAGTQARSGEPSDKGGAEP